MRRIGLALLLALSATGCATGYQPQGLTGGYTDREVAPNIWWVRYAGNAYTTAETVQTFWLYHAAELTIAKGFDGFQILPGARPPAAGTATELPVDLGVVGKPVLTEKVLLLKNPVVPRPPIVFDAHALRDTLAPHVKEPLCGGNVCPHVHTYLTPNTQP
jgi:hypothetical protein